MVSSFLIFSHYFSRLNVYELSRENVKNSGNIGRIGYLDMKMFPYIFDNPTQHNRDIETVNESNKLTSTKVQFTLQTEVKQKVGHNLNVCVLNLVPIVSPKSSLTTISLVKVEIQIF